MNDNLVCITLSHSRESGNPDAYTFKKGDVTPFFTRLTVDNHKGFTLIEILVSLVVMSIIAVVAGVGLVEISKGYVFSKKNAVTTQQGQIAMARLKKEISSITSVSSSAANNITFTRSSGGPPVTILWDGGSSPLWIDSDILVQPVTSFILSYFEFNLASSDPFKFTNSSYSSKTSIIEVTLQLRAAEDTPITLIDRVHLYQETGG